MLRGGMRKGPFGAGGPCSAGSSPGAAAFSSRSSVQTCPGAAVGGVSQDSTGEGGGTTRTPVLSGKGDGSRTTLTAVLPLNSPLFPAVPTPAESRRGSGQTGGDVPGAAGTLEDGRGARRACEFMERQSWRK